MVALFKNSTASYLLVQKIQIQKYIFSNKAGSYPNIFESFQHKEGNNVTAFSRED
jgi:hypothetical protein